MAFPTSRFRIFTVARSLTLSEQGPRVALVERDGLDGKETLRPGGRIVVVGDEENRGRLATLAWGCRA
jgi:hypothetical protein